jgi:hypothetical protein
MKEIFIDILNSRYGELWAWAVSIYLTMKIIEDLFRRK